MNLENCWSENDYNFILNETGKRLWRFVYYNGELVESKYDFTADLLKLKKSDINTLKKIHFLVSDEVLMFIKEAAPKIIRRLSKVTKRPKVKKNKITRGKLDIQGTIKDKLTHSNFNGYVIRERHTDFNIDKNKAFKYILEFIYLTAKDVINYEDMDDNLDKDEINKWTQIIRELAYKSREMLKNINIRVIDDIGYLDSRMIEAVERSRNYWHEFLADVLNLYYNVFEEDNNENFFRKMLENKVLKPLDKNTLYEVFILFDLYDLLEELEWIPEEISLIGGKQKFDSYIKFDNNLNMYYQSLPNLIKENSLYGDLLDSYNLNHRSRQPDIILKKDNNYCVIEIKRSKSKKYILDGVYKLMGYLKDYETTVTEGINNIKGILVSWELPSIPDEYPDNEIILSDYTNFKKIMRKLLLNY